ncbi:HAMP domain-containing sensor histidine kinase [Candidatus Contubernalis alkaliaceticus]|uniref:HAMP domain-containing sensor histidine kinase n=1 Tax=Candidatus Contubernalis alkaliaceticus TaxID=338645 RepID=UPI001F4C324D|nr:HAMP domain-containing sensor histidine kinase [Candidatus Contubernalis alkalaceticus]UNC91369.1 HAMP domain-containing histidine kinase [Candidatus Contubernalis alkalaceticus]
MKKISVKLALFFITIICVSSILSFIVTIFFTSGLKEEIKFNQETIAIAILDLRQKTDLRLEEIISIISSSMYEVRTIENIEEIQLTAEELKKLQNHEIIFLSRLKFQGHATLLMVDDSYIQINLYPHNTVFKIVGSRVWFTLLSFVFIAAMLIILLVKRIVRPVVNLTWATQEVAKGNFNVQLEHKSEDEIGQLMENFNKMTKELNNIELLRKDFITNVSHEFKTPIASIQGFAKLLQQGNLSDDEKQEYTNIIVEETARLSNLSSNILKLSKIENQEIVEKMTLFSLDEQIRKSILLLEHAWSKKNIELDINLEKVNYVGDEGLLEQIWLNLLSNAIKFSDVNGIIGIRLSKTISAVKVIIKDNGIGMREENMMRIFEKFYQGDKTHSHEGNGLGLPLVKRILDLLGGKIYVESKLQEGSTFTVELPL